MAFPTLDVLDKNSAPQTINTLPNAGQATKANSLPVTLASDQFSDTAPLVTRRALYRASASFQKPSGTTAYAGPTSTSNGHLIANHATAGSVVPMSFTLRGVDQPLRLQSVKLETDHTGSAGITLSSFRLHWFDQVPVFGIGDHTALLLPKTGWLGTTDVYVGTMCSDGAVGMGYPTTNNEIAVYPVSGTATLYAVLEARAAYAPITVETFTVTPGFE